MDAGKLEVISSWFSDQHSACAASTKLLRFVVDTKKTRTRRGHEAPLAQNILAPIDFRTRGFKNAVKRIGDACDQLKASDVAKAHRMPQHNVDCMYRLQGEKNSVDNTATTLQVTTPQTQAAKNEL